MPLQLKAFILNIINVWIIYTLFLHLDNDFFLLSFVFKFFDFYVHDYKAIQFYIFAWINLKKLKLIYFLCLNVYKLNHYFSFVCYELWSYFILNFKYIVICKKKILKIFIVLKKNCVNRLAHYKVKL